MGFGKTVGGITKGADLTRPRLSLSWILPAIVAAVLLAVVAGIAYWLYNKAKAPVMSIVAKAPGVSSVATGSAPGTETSGWIS